VHLSIEARPESGTSTHARVTDQSPVPICPYLIFSTPEARRVPSPWCCVSLRSGLDFATWNRPYLLVFLFLPAARQIFPRSELRRCVFLSKLSRSLFVSVLVNPGALQAFSYCRWCKAPFPRAGCVLSRAGPILLRTCAHIISPVLPSLFV
jgi:hypothetical protein